MSVGPSVKSHSGRRFGATVALVENTLVVVERPNEFQVGQESCAIYPFIAFQYLFLPSQNDRGSYPFDPSKPLIMSSMFGYSVSISEDTLAVGAPGKGTPGRKGAVLRIRDFSRFQLSAQI